MIIYTVKHTKNLFGICEAFVEEKSAQDYVDAVNANRDAHVPDSKIRYFVEPMEVHEG